MSCIKNKEDRCPAKTSQELQMLSPSHNCHHIIGVLQKNKEDRCDAKKTKDLPVCMPCVFCLQHSSRYPKTLNLLIFAPGKPHETGCCP